MIRTKHGLPLLLLVCILIGILCSVVSACITRNATEAATTQECTIVSANDIGSFQTTRIRCPERNYRCFRYTQSAYGSSISCVALNL